MSNPTGEICEHGGAERNFRVVMKRTLRVCGLALVVCYGLGGIGACAGTARRPLDAVQGESMWAPINALAFHPKAVVRWPSAVGAVVGGVVGLPVAVVLLPVTIPLSRVDAPGGANLLPLAPIFLAADGGAILLGGVPWLVFGWW